MVVPVGETELSAASTEVAAGAGGIILFGSQAPADLGNQVATLRRLVPGGLGLLVMTDEEGGGVQRMANLVGSLPWGSSMGASWTPAEITRQVAAVARAMARYGVNMDLAPVVDVDGRNMAPGASNPDGWRAFSGNPAVVAADGAAYMRGLQAGGVIPVLKHFPGLGGSTANTDYAPAQTLPWTTLQNAALPPFTTGIAAGAPAIMVSNATIPGLSQLPASLSPAVVDQLSGPMHFGGLILTDSLSAGAISAAGYDPSAAAVQALRAGEDMVMFTSLSTPSAVQAQFQAIVTAITVAVTAGSLPRNRLVSAATAVLRTLKVNVCP